jgi:hypothetical protein
MAGNEVKAVHLNASGSAATGRGRLKGFLVNHDTGASGVTLIYDNASAASGPVLLELDDTDRNIFGMEIPGDGIIFENGLYVDLATATTLTLFVQK